MLDERVAEWLLDTDPALRWQVERDLIGAPDDVWQATRARVATEGFGARLLAQQDDDGQWAGGPFFPAGWQFDSGQPQPWTATTWALKDLREWGVDAAVLAGTAEKLASARWEYQDLPYWGGEVDVCINSWTLSNGLWLGAPVDGLVDWFLDHQLADGGWNCEWVEGSSVGSFHSTLNALVGLLDYQLTPGDAERVRAARTAGEEYLLRRSLFKRLTTGEPFFEHVFSFAYPRRAYYHVLAAADYFRAAAQVDAAAATLLPPAAPISLPHSTAGPTSLPRSTAGPLSPPHSTVAAIVAGAGAGGSASGAAAPDPRMAEAIDAIRARRQSDGTWLQGHRLPGDVWFHVDAPAGQPSPWLTLQALRVLAWWDADS